jgi:catechol 2,3-dioxygenase-like lactoylglutathione lyase family enzyme
LPATSLTDVTTPLGPVDQIGIVVPDLETALDQYGRLFSIEEWLCYRYTHEFFPWSEYRQNPGGFGMKLAMSLDSGTQVELIQPLTGPSVYDEFTRAGRWGLHHLGVFVDNIDSAISLMDAAGYGVTQSARGYGQNGDGGFAYFDTEDDLHVVIEAIEVPSVRRPGLVWRTGEGVK